MGNDLKACYRSSSKDEKTDWSQCLVDYVHAYGGRFLRFRKDEGIWYEVSNREARKKAGQALREENTPESRAAKRKVRQKQNAKKKIESRILKTKNKGVKS